MEFINKTTTIEFDGEKYKIGVQAFRTKYSKDLLVKIIKILMSTARPIISGFAKEVSENDKLDLFNLDPKAINWKSFEFNKVFDSIMDIMEDEQYEELIEALLYRSNIQLISKEKQRIYSFKNKDDSFDSDTYDMVFAGRLGLIPKVIVFVLEVNYKNFLPMFLRKILTAEAKEAAKDKVKEVKNIVANSTKGFFNSRKKNNKDL